VALVTVGLAPWAMGWLFGAAFAPAAGVAQLLAVATVALNACRVLGAGLKAAGVPERAGLGELIGAALTLAGMLALLPRLGLLGAGLAAALSYAASLAYLACEASRRLGVPPRALLAPTRADAAWLRAACRRWRAAPLPA
jgi:O-antigen/teichoic acid export membrane protein